ncbi:MAG: Hpt domain-containing protein [Methylococcaceae bacterium]|jgi:Hpt domain.
MKTSPDYVGILLDKTKDNHQLTRTIVHKLFAELPNQIADIDNALAKEEYSVAKEITHKLHGTVSFCGFVNFQTLAYGLENSLVHNNTNEIKQNFTTLAHSVMSFIAQKEILINDSRLLI